MKAMFLSDMIIMRKYLVQQSIAGLVLGIILAALMENCYVIPTIIGAMVAVTCAFTTLALDERNDWEQFRLTLPLSRAQVVAGRYASIGAATLVGFAVGFVALLIVVAAGAALGDSVGLLSFAARGIDLKSLAAIFALSLFVVSVMLSVTLPLALRFGMTKAVRFLPIAIVVIVLAVFAASGAADSAGLTASINTFLARPSGMAAVVGGGIVAAVVLYLVSALASKALYAQRAW